MTQKFARYPAKVNKMLPRSGLAYTLLILTALFWAGNAIVGRMAAGIIPPLTLTAVRWLLTVMVLYLLARPHLKEAMPVLMAHRLYLFLMGAIGFAFFNMSLYGALNYTTALNVAIEQSAMPMVILIAMWLFDRMPIAPAQGIGALLSVAGVMVTVSAGDLSRLATLAVNKGDAIMMGAVLAYALYSVFLKRRPQVPWQVFMFALAIAATLFSFPFALIEIANGHYPAADWRTPAVIVYVTIFPSLLAQVLYLKGVEIIGAGRAGLFINLVPVFAGTMAISFLGERFETYHAIGTALVICGITLAEVAARRQRQDPPQA